MPNVQFKGLSDQRTLSLILSHFQERGELKVEQVQHAFGRSRSGAYDIIGGSMDDVAGQVNHAIKTLPAPIAQGVASLLVSGSAFEVRTVCEAVTHEDGAAASIQAVEQAAACLRAFHEAMADRILTGEEAARLTMLSNDLRRTVDAMDRWVGKFTGVRAAK